jgi:hypothetical protein
MEQVALVVIDALIVGQFPCIEVPDGIDHDVELFFVDLGMLDRGDLLQEERAPFRSLDPSE